MPVSGISSVTPVFISRGVCFSNKGSNAPNSGAMMIMTKFIGSSVVSLLTLL